MFLLFFLFFITIKAQEIPGRRYSYVCLSANDDLCFGVSSGGVTVDQAFELQLKFRKNNELKGLDGNKTRWDLNLTTQGQFKSSSNRDYCIQRTGQKNKVQIKKGCVSSEVYFNLTRLNQNKEMSGQIQHLKTKLCLTVMKCLIIVNNGRRFCDKSINIPERSGVFQDTSYIKLWPCFFNPTRGNLMDIKAQTFRNRLDCVPGCTVNMQDNDKCDDACNTPLCDMDNGLCNTQSPTPPTRSPSNNPSVSPTLHPTSIPTVSPSETPTNNPTTSTPTKSPTTSPSAIPSQSPTNLPSINPSFRPSNKPSIAPSHSPSKSPSASPTRANTTSPAILVVAATGSNLLWLLLLLLILCCIPFCFWYRRNKDKKDSLDEEEIVETIKHETPPVVETPLALPTPSPKIQTPPLSPELYEAEMPVFTLPPPRTIKKEIDVNNTNWIREGDKKVSFRKSTSNNYKETDIPAETLDVVLKELLQKQSISKT